MRLIVANARVDFVKLVESFRREVSQGIFDVRGYQNTRVPHSFLFLWQAESQVGETT
jgi:hypothetical protein